jgi:hypothetical protein
MLRKVWKRHSFSKLARLYSTFFLKKFLCCGMVTSTVHGFVEEERPWKDHTPSMVKGTSTHGERPWFCRRVSQPHKENRTARLITATKKVLMVNADLRVINRHRDLSGEPLEAFGTMRARIATYFLKVSQSHGLRP